jgi:sporulation protein YabP
MKVETKKEVRIEDRKSNLILENRKKLVLTGVVEVISFDEEKILLNTTQGMLTIRGNELKMNKLDVQNGDVVIVGTVNSFTYTGSEVKQDKESILAKLFK